MAALPPAASATCLVNYSTCIGCCDGMVSAWRYNGLRGQTVRGEIMATTLEEMEKRLLRLEEDVANLKQLFVRQRIDETPAERGARLLREAKANQPAISAAVAKAFAEMGIVGKPVGIEKLREMMIECGIKPEDNEFSRDIIAMR